MKILIADDHAVVRQGYVSLLSMALEPCEIMEAASGEEACDFSRRHQPDLIIIATGSEMEIARQATESLQQEGVKARLVAMPSVDVFERQDSEYREAVLPANVRKRVAVEAGIEDYWRKLVGLDGAVIGMTSFGESAPGPALMEYFGFTADNVVNVASSLQA